VGTRRTDWVQFGILLFGILTAAVSGALAAGEILQEVKELHYQVDDLQRRLASIESQWQLYQSTHPSSLTVR